MAAASVAAMRRVNSKRIRERTEFIHDEVPPQDDWICRHDVNMLMLDG